MHHPKLIFACKTVTKKQQAGYLEISKIAPSTKCIKIGSKHLSKLRLHIQKNKRTSCGQLKDNNNFNWETVSLKSYNKHKLGFGLFSFIFKEQLPYQYRRPRHTWHARDRVRTNFFARALRGAPWLERNLAPDVRKWQDFRSKTCIFRVQDHVLTLVQHMAHRGPDAHPDALKKCASSLCCECGGIAGSCFWQIFWWTTWCSTLARV